MRKLDKALSISLAVAIAVALGCLVYVITAPKQGEKFTEFYILNAEGKAENYPNRLALGEPVELVLGVVNHEYEPTSYRVEIMTEDTQSKEVSVPTLAHEEKWEKAVSFTPYPAGEGQKVEFWLYKNDKVEPYFDDPLHLYIDIKQFYILNAEGKAEDYPRQVALGEPVDLMLGIVNDEYETASYRVDIKIDGVSGKVVKTEPLAHWEKWEKPISLLPRTTGKKQKVEFWLYKEAEFGSCFEDVLCLNIDVTELAFFPEKVERYTEFYILNAEGKAEDYPSRVALGEPIELTVGVVSHEYELTSYRVEIEVDGRRHKAIRTGPLAHCEKWEELVSFIPRTPGERQEVELRLYKEGDFEPYFKDPIHFYIDVMEASAARGE